MLKTEQGQKKGVKEDTEEIPSDHSTHSRTWSCVIATPESSTEPEIDPDVESCCLPWWWELVWKVDIMKKGEQHPAQRYNSATVPTANLIRTNIELIFSGYSSLDNCPLGEFVSLACKDTTSNAGRCTNFASVVTPRTSSTIKVFWPRF